MIEAWLAAKLGGFGAKLAEYGIAIAVVAGAVWFAYSWAYDRGVASQTAIVAQGKATTTRALDANAADASTIATLKTQNASCVASVAAKTSAAEAASAQLIQLQAARAAQAQTAHKAREVIYAYDQQTAACGARPIPDDLAVQLRH